MKLIPFFVLFISLNVYFDVARGFGMVKKIFNILMEPSRTDAKETSLVLGIENSSNFCILANCDILKNRKNPNFGTYLFACPAETQEELNINLQESKTKHALFIKDSYGKINLEADKKKKKSDGDEKRSSDASDSNIKNFEYIEYYCKHPLDEPSIYNHVTTKMNGIDIEIFLIGYEVYMGETYQKLNVLPYDKIMNLKKGFKWFNVLTIRIDRKRGNVMTVNSETFNNESFLLPPKLQYPVKKTQIRSNSLGYNVFFKYFSMANAYAVESQEELFQKLFHDSSLKNLYFNRTQGRYLLETYLAPPNTFANPILEKAALTYANIVPMWKIIRETSWARLEDYIKHLVQGLFGIFVINGTYGTLQLSGKEIHLVPPESVRVPLAFFKIVTFTKKSYEFYNMLIITMNNPYEDVSHGLCETSQCKKFGWDYIEQDFYPYGRTTCCEITDDIIDKLQLNDLIQVDRVLNLRAVPHLKDGKLTMNVTKFIEDRKKALSYDPDDWADSSDYVNEKNFSLKTENNDDKKDEDKLSVSQFASALFKDHLLPGLTSFPKKAKDYIGSKVYPLGGQKDDAEVKIPLLGDQKEDVEEKNPVGDQKDDFIEKDSLDDQKDETRKEKSLSSDQTDDAEEEKSLESGQKDEIMVKKSVPSKQKDDELKELMFNGIKNDNAAKEAKI